MGRDGEGEDFAGDRLEGGTGGGDGDGGDGHAERGVGVVGEVLVVMVVRGKGGRERDEAGDEVELARVELGAGAAADGGRTERR